MNDITDANKWDEVLDFWFPEGRALQIDADVHQKHWFWRLQGGADSQILAGFPTLTSQAAESGLNHWATDPEGRLALIILLDQFSRSLWRGSPRAFAQDRAALASTLDGVTNGHYAALSAPWFKIVYTQPLGHCEGPDHLERIDLLIRLREEVAADAPAYLRHSYELLVKQARDVRKVIAAFGRHPHRNQVLGRQSTNVEIAYIADGDFPHERAFR